VNQLISINVSSGQLLALAVFVSLSADGRRLVAIEARIAGLAWTGGHQRCTLIVLLAT
jgi:hypothetical protein